MMHAIRMMQGLTCHKSRRIMELFIQARQEIGKYEESFDLELFFERSSIKTSVRDIGLAILFDSDTVTSNFTDDLSKLSEMYKGLFIPVKTLLHQIKVDDETNSHIFEVYTGGGDSVFVGSVYDVVELARRINLRNGDRLDMGYEHAQTVLYDDEAADFAYDHDMVLSQALQDPVTGPKPLGILSKSSNSPNGPKSGEKGVYRAVSRLQQYAPCYYKVANIRGFITISALEVKRSGKHKWVKVSRFSDGLVSELLDIDLTGYHTSMLDPEKTYYTHSSFIPALGDIDYYMVNKVKQHAKSRYKAL